MSRIHPVGEHYYYEDQGFDIELNQTTYQAWQHRNPGFKLMDLIAVHDPRDNLKFTHWRFNQPPDAFEQMLALAVQIGSFTLTDTPLEFVEDNFMKTFGLKDNELDELLGSDDA